MTDLDKGSKNIGFLLTGPQTFTLLLGVEFRFEMEINVGFHSIDLPIPRGRLVASLIAMLVQNLFLIGTMVIFVFHLSVNFFRPKNLNEPLGLLFSAASI